jgi:predicted ATPase/transcriptional regulator with XRE-family HTH domain
VAVPEPFAELLLRHRVAVGLSQRELAERSGLSERALRNLENSATTRPRRHSVRALAAAIGLHGDDLAAFLAAAWPGPAGREPGPPRRPAVSLARPTELVGRDGQVRALIDLVTGGRYRLITVTGPGGVGKSRLAAELATVLRADGHDVRSLDLAALAEPELVGELIAEILGFGGPSRLDPVDRIAAQLRDRRVLVLDGFERLVAAAPVVAALVRRCDRLTVLTTSQRALRVGGERTVRLAPLPVTAAVDLFARRAEAAAPGFAVTAGNAAAVAAICRQLDGLPLAIELAAARMRLLTPTELADRLDRPLRLLTDGARDAPARHRSLRAAIESSLQVVGADARTLFAWLAPFVAGARLDDLEAVAGRLAADRGWLLDPLTELVDASLVQVRTPAAGTRYVLLDAMRELAGELLRDRPDRVAVERATAGRYLDRLRLCGARTTGDGYADLDADADNVRAALTWIRDNDPALVDVPVIEALHRYYDLRGRFTEGRATLAALADAKVAAAPRALLSAGRLAQFQGDLDEAERLVRRGQETLGADDHAGHVTAGLVLGIRAHTRGDLPAAVSHMSAALASARAAGVDRTIGWALNNLAAVTAQGGDLVAAQDLMREALDVKDRTGADDVDRGRTLVNLTDLALATGAWPEAVDRAGQAVLAFGRGGHRRLEAAALSSLALARWRAGDPAGGAVAMGRATDRLAEFGEDRWLRGLVLARRSVFLHIDGEPDRVPAMLDEAVAATRTEPMRYHVPPVVEAHATLLADGDPATADRLRSLADNLRAGTGKPTATLTAVARLLEARPQGSQPSRTMRSKPTQVSLSPPPP